MRKFFIILTAIFIFPTLLYAQDYDLSRKNPILQFDPPAEKKFWVTITYAGIISLGDIAKDVRPSSKYGINVGGTFWKGIGLELSFKGYIQQRVNLEYPEINERLITTFGQADIGAKLIYRPSFMLDDFPMMFISPYISAGANLIYLPSYSLEKYPIDRESYKGFYPAIKAGLHFSVLNFLIGASVEYIPQNVGYKFDKYDFTNLSIGFEAGAAF